MFGNKGREAVKKEIKQLHDRGVLQAVHKADLSWEQIKQALNYLMFLKRKRCGKVKGRGCADGRKQRGFIPKEDAASPTVSTEAVFITAVVGAGERLCCHSRYPRRVYAFRHGSKCPYAHRGINGRIALGSRL